MKLSRKMKQQLKKNILTGVASMAIVVTLIAAGNKAGFFTSLNEFVAGKIDRNGTENSISNISETSTTVSRLSNTATTTYIYDVADLVAFRDSVNAGDTHAGKTVYLMADIDLSTVCSSTLGSWTPIGATGQYFTGVFDGNYHTIHNLYIKTGTYDEIGLFSRLPAGGTLKNLVLKNPYVYNSYTAYSRTAAFVGRNYGTIMNCGSVGGSITGYQTTTATAYKAVVVGAIVGYNYGTVRGCYNTSAISATANTSNTNCQVRTGGIVGISAEAVIDNCYNMGSVTGKGYTVYLGGVAGLSYTLSATATKPSVTNCYNTGAVTISGGTKKYAGGVLAANGMAAKNQPGTLSNCYCTTGTTYANYYWNGSSLSTSTTGRVAAATIKTYSVKLKNGYAYDVYNQNNGYPVLAWQNDRTVMTLNQNQAYMKIGETLPLHVEKDDRVTEKIGNNYEASHFTWKSTNEDVATVDANGQVRGISEGYTTIYAKHEASGLYAMSIINVAKDFANPQIGTGNGFTIILKADGTVWGIGNNANGQLGNGTTENSNVAVQVKIDEDTVLDNVIKIACGTDHVLALTKSGNIYAWGLNDLGQLGQNNTEASKFAKLVLGTTGTNYLSNIVDIDAGSYSSAAVDRNGNVYVWGQGKYGEIGNNAKLAKSLPTKNSMKHALQVSIGSSCVTALTAEGAVWSWGRNYDGQLGINTTDDTSYPMKSAFDVIDMSTGSYHTMIRKVDETLYAVGCYIYGRLGTGSTVNEQVYKKVNLPSTVTANNKVKYIKGGRLNTTLLLSDGTVWETGYNGNGECGNGTTANTDSFVQGKLNETEPMGNVLTIGKNMGNRISPEGYGLNTAVILQDGDIYITGNNTYGQIGDNTTKDTLYYKKVGFADLQYGEKSVEIGEDGYQIDTKQLKYVSSFINVYGDKEDYKVGELKYTSSNPSLAKVSEGGKVTAAKGATGVTTIRIEDITNGYYVEFEVIVNKMLDTDTITYIYNTDDLVKVRDNVNAGNNYAGKTVYLMADLDMREVCSESKGTWVPIGVSGRSFAGTFDGNYHKIHHLYIKTGSYYNVGLFGELADKGIIKNVIVKEPNIYNSYTGYSRTAAIAGRNYGKILNCASVGGTITGYQTKEATAYKSVVVGGIVGYNYGTVTDSYNTSDIFATANTSNSNCQTRSGGVVGLNGTGTILNCYNMGNITGKAYHTYLGGVTSASYTLSGITAKPVIKNCYNYGNIKVLTATKQMVGGITAGHGFGRANVPGTFSNNYCTTTTTYSYYYWNGSSMVPNTAGRTAPETLKGYTSKLGKAYENDTYGMNRGYPILWWQVPTVELNKKQAYIAKGENLELNIINSRDVSHILGDNIQTTDFIWKSTNEDIATVNENGVVTGLKDGYTTIYGQHKTMTEIYTMCKINVAQEVATPMIETGEGFTAILKADGTVWGIGNNSSGQLGDGTNEERLEARQVKIDEHTYLEGVIKISCGTNYVVALTKEGKVYAWGANGYGQLGQNDKQDSPYAKQVLGEGGSGTLERIIDISCGTYGVAAMNEFGWVYVWGNGSYGEMGNLTNISNSTPVKSVLNTAIQVSMGAGHASILSQSGHIYTWGRNSYGELGVGNTTNSNTVMGITSRGVDISSAGYETVLTNVAGEVWASGLNTKGQLGTGTQSNANLLTKVNLPTVVTEANKVKYIKAGRTSTSLMLTDGSIWTVGSNANGELGNGDYTDSTTFVQGKTASYNLNDVMAIGRSNGNSTSLNIPAICEDGRVYTAGNNTYAQIGNGTKDNTNYFTVMGMTKVTYDQKITLPIGDTKNIAKEELAYAKVYFNVYHEDKEEKSLVDAAKILDSSIASYENGTLTAKKVGNTILMVKEEEKNILIYIPVEVVPTNGTIVPDAKSGENFTATLKTDGTIWTFGTNTKGELGLGDKIDRNLPHKVPFVEDKVVTQIAVGTSHVIALTDAGEIYSFGLNTKGQLGIVGTKNSDLPQKVELPENTELVPVIEEKAVKIIANKNVSYVIMQNGKIYAWGEGYGTSPKSLELELTNSSDTANPNPSQKDIVHLSNHYGLDINGNVYDLRTKERIAIVEKIKYLSEGTSHTVFLSENKTAYSIGSNEFGQLGDGTNVPSETGAVAVRDKELTDRLSSIEKIEAGCGYSTALLEDGKILEWGKNQDGQLGTDEVNESNSARENTNIAKLVAETNEEVMLMDAGSNHVAIVLSNGDVYSWGLGENGEFGNGENRSSHEPQKAGREVIEANANHLLLHPNDTFDLEAGIEYFNLLEDKKGEITYESKNETVVQVDENTGKVTGVAPGMTTILAKERGTTNLSVIQVRVIPEGLAVEPQVWTNGSHTVTLKANGSVWSYGNNENGELGNGTTKYADEPVEAIFPEGITIVQVTGGENFSAALDSDGNVWTWGRNDYGQLGTNASGMVTRPTKIENLSNITKITAGTYHMLAIDENKEVYGWGLNANGELGIGSYTNKITTPTKAKYVRDTLDIAGGKNHSILVKTTGEVYVTGLNMHGQCGNNDTSVKKVNEFTKVQGINRIARISSTDSGNMVLTVDGKVYTWGLNIHGELGLGDNQNRLTPTAVGGVDNAVMVAGGKNHSMILDKFGKVYTTGANEYGQCRYWNKTR